MDIFVQIGLIGAGGILGSLITILIKHFLDKDKIQNERIFNLKKEIYLNTIDLFDRQELKSVSSIEKLKDCIGDKKKVLEELMDYNNKLDFQLGKARFIAGKELRNLLNAYSKTITDFQYCVIKASRNIRQNGKAKRSIDEDFKKLCLLQEQIKSLMKKEIGI